MELSTDRKVALLSGHDDWHTEAIPELGLPAVLMTDGPHGLRKVTDANLLDVTKSEPATCFPTAAGLGATWDRRLVAEVGVAIAAEARAAGVAVVLGPGINIKRHPCCGRNFEYLSEDPHLAGELAVAYIDAVQAAGVGTSVKHYAVNNQEAHRMVVDVIVDDRTLREIYLPAFETAVTRARPWTIIGAYNRVNGTYCCEDPFLLATVLRDEWGFDGLLVTDWGANNSRVAAVRAGMDLEMPGGAGAQDAEVHSALAAGTLAASALDACVERVVALARRSAESAPRPDETFDADAHHALARRAAAASAVLLTNRDMVLPLEPTARVAVIGDFAAHPRYQGAGSSKVNPTRLDDALTEMGVIARAAGGRVDFAAGCDRGAAASAELVDQAARVAANADAAVVFVGLPPAWESEGFDRDHIGLPESFDRLVAAVAAANPRTVVVLANGAPVAMPWVDDVAAVVEAYLGGQAAGGGIADVLYGVAEPGGRLAETFPRALADVASDQWFPGAPRQVQYREGLYVGYRWFDSANVEVLFPFGHGLSYTTFALTDAGSSCGDLDGDDPGATVDVTVTVTNTGDRPGADVVQVYVRAPDAVPRPDKELRGFDKIHLDPGESATVTITLGRRAFAHWDVASDAWQVEPGRYEVLIGTSSRTIHAELPLEVRSSFAPAPEPAIDAAYRPDGPAWTVGDEAFAALLGRPVPPVDPDRPFTRNSTLGELGTTTLGRPVVATLRAAIARLVRGADTDGGLGAMVDRALMELPVRNVAAMTGGRVSISAVDRLVALANRLTRSG